MTANEYPPNDRQWQEHRLTAVEVGSEEGEYTLNCDGMCLGVSKCPVRPEPGHTVRYYGKGFGHTVRGVFVNGTKVYYRTEAEEDERHRKWVAEEKQKRYDEFLRNKDSIDRRVERLPAIFQQRLQRFRDANDEFRFEYEGYELFCCEQAVVFATALQTTEALQAWAKKPYEEQKAQVPGIDDGHSGNTFGMSVRLAHWYLTHPENVVKEHGALVPLVGCEAYGCHHPQPATG